MELKLVYIENQEEFDRIVGEYKPKHRRIGDFTLSPFKFEGPKKYLYSKYKSLSDEYVIYFYSKDIVERRLVEVQNKFEETVTEMDMLEEFLK